MAKIGNLQVDTIHMAPGAFTSSIDGSYDNDNQTYAGSILTLTAPESPSIVQLYWSCAAFVSSRSNGAQNELTFRVRRASSTPVVLYEQFRKPSNGSSYRGVWSGSILDTTPTDPPKYDIYVIALNNSSNARVYGSMACVWIKK